MRVDRRLRVSDTWGCGRIGQTPRMEYTATAFAEPLRRVFAVLYRPTEDLSIDFHPESQVLRPVDRVPERGRIPGSSGASTRPSWRSFAGWPSGCAGCRPGSLHLYLLYMIVALVVLLLVSRWTS